MARRPWANALDMYRKVPTDLLEGTKRGSAMSYLCLFSIGLLFYLETRSFFSSSIATNIALDSNREERFRVNFNVTMMDLRCDYATIDVVSVLGTDQNVTQHVTKFGVDAEGVKQRYAGRNKNQHDIVMSDELVTESIEELHENGEDAISLDSQTLQFAKANNEFLFVDFYASWCSHCRDLAPTWEVLAEAMTDSAAYKLDQKVGDRVHEYSDEDYDEALKLELPVFVGKVDCVDHPEVCSEHTIRGYPTLRLFHNGEYKMDYQGHREVVEMTHWLAGVEERLHPNIPLEERKSGIGSADELARERLEVEDTREDMKTPPKRPDTIKGSYERSPEEEEWTEKMKKHRVRQQTEWNDEDHPGCQLSGFLMVDRAPGHFRIQARSNHHDIAAQMTNVSHEIHHLSFGDPHIVRTLEKAEKKNEIENVVYPPNFLPSTHPMDGNAYVTTSIHEAPHHFLKVISTGLKRLKIPKQSKYKPPETPYLSAYTFLQSSQLSFFRNDVVPEAKFTYDLSPIAVSYQRKGRHWYDYLTNLMAIVGGTFTLFGILESGVGAVAGKRRR